MNVSYAPAGGEQSAMPRPRPVDALFVRLWRNFSHFFAVIPPVTASYDAAGLSAPPATRRAAHVWAAAAQIAVVILTALALIWGKIPIQQGETPLFINTPPAPMHQMLIAILGGACAVAALGRGRTRAEQTAVLAAMLLATACWLTVANRNNSPHFLDFSASPTLAAAHVPTLAPVVAAVALVLGVWGLVVRWLQARRHRAETGNARPATADIGFGAVALFTGAFVLIYAVKFYLFLNNVAPFNQWYGVEPYQLLELTAIVVLYPAALWLGAAAAREEEQRPSFFPWALAVTAILTLCWWQVP
jgi:hypothetical protein